MRKIIAIVSLLVSCTSYAVDTNVLSDIAEQFSARKWYFKAAQFSKKALLSDYSNYEYITSAIDSQKKLSEMVEASSSQALSLAFPNDGITDEEGRLSSLEHSSAVVSSYTLISKWSDLLKTLSTDKVLDDVSGDCKTSSLPAVDNPSCGRISKGDYVVEHMPVSLRKNIREFLNVVLSDLEDVNSEEINISVGPELARIFQVLFDKRAISYLLQSRYFDISDRLSGHEFERMRNQTALMRSILVQSFQGEGGVLRDSDLNSILLEDETCADLATAEDVIQCQHSYIKNLFFNPTLKTNAQDLVFDQKFSSSFLDSALLRFESLGRQHLDEEYLALWASDLQDTFGYVYSLSIDPSSFLAQDIESFVEQLYQGSGYLIQRRTILSLQFAKKIQVLIRAIEEQP